MLDLKLMFVEDDTILRERLEKILKREISNVKSYPLASDALKDFESFKPDIILTDIKMPGMNGLQMVEVIRKTFPNIPVIIASAFSDLEFFQNAIKLKVENYVVKPIDVEELLNTIRSVYENIRTKKLLSEKESLLEQYKHIVDLSAYITITDKKGVIIYANDKFCLLSGYSQKELIGSSHNIVRHPDVPKIFFKKLWQHLLQKKVWQGIMKDRRKDGSTFYVDTTIAPILDQKGEISEFISIKTDISDLIMSKQRLETDIITDRLTKLHNRIKLQEDIHVLDDYTLLLIDIDRFKEVNLLFGIRFGDMLLKYFADTIRGIFLNEDIKLYRVASDEFVLLAEGDKRERLKELSEKLRLHVNTTPFEFENVSFDLDFTCALIHTDKENINSLEQLQSTMSEAKRKKHFLLEHDVNAMLQKEYEENFEWTKKVKSALNEDRLVVFFQPIYDIKKDHVTKFETLVRLIEEDGTVISPFKFLNAAKRSRNYRDLTLTVIKKACETFGGTEYNFSINLSIEDLTDEVTLEYLIKEVQSRKLQNRIIVEILESEGIDNFNTIQKVFKRLSQAGLQIAIDDFGSGYSNFAYLVNLPVSILKIDGSLIKNIAHDNSSRIIVQSIVMFAHELNIEVIAEFVSDEDVFDAIRSLDIDFAQGFYIGKPEPVIDDTFKDIS